MRPHCRHPLSLREGEGRSGVFWKLHGLPTRKKEVVWVRRGEVALAKAVKVPNFRICYF